MSDNQYEKTSVLMEFCSLEMVHFFERLAAAIRQHRETQEAPVSMFEGGAPTAVAHTPKPATNGRKRQHTDKPKTKRKPSVFNLFVKHKMAEYRAQGINAEDKNNQQGFMTMAVAEWSKQTPQDKLEWAERFKVGFK